VIAIYAVSIVLGILGILTWVAMGLASGSLAGKAHLDPEDRFGDRGRVAISSLSGFGLGGMSASFGGWNDGLAIVAAVLGAVVAVLIARYLGFEEDPDGDSA